MASESALELIDDELKIACGQVYLTRKNLLILRCALCREKFGTFRNFIHHLSTKHFNSAFIEAENSQPFKKTSEDHKYEVIENTEGSNDCNSVIKSPAPSIDNNDETGININYTEVVNFKKECGSPFEPNKSNELDSRVTHNRNKSSSTLNRQRKALEKNEKQERNHLCDICNARFTDRSNMLAHKKRHTGDKEHQCSMCPKRFFTRSELKTHMCLHTGEKPFVCELCGKRFLTSGALRGHMRRHTNERPYQCEHCDRRFFDGTLLKDHQVTHTKERKHICEVCSSAFMMKKTLRQHMKIHANKREYVCIICHAAFNQRPALFLHMKKHGEKLQNNDAEQN